MSCQKYFPHGRPFRRTPYSTQQRRRPSQPVFYSLKNHFEITHIIADTAKIEITEVSIVQVLSRIKRPFSFINFNSWDIPISSSLNLCVASSCFAILPLEISSLLPICFSSDVVSLLKVIECSLCSSKTFKI